MTLTLAQLPPWASAGLVVFFLFICVLLILTVLIQRPAGGGLSGAFGSGAGSGQTAFGAKTGDALTIATIAMFVVYILFAIGLNYATRPGGTGGGAAAVAAPTAPAESTAPAPAVPPQPAELGPIPGSSQSGPNTDGTPTTTPPAPAPGDQPVTTPPAPPPASEEPAAPPSQQEPSAQPPAPGTPPPAEPAPQPAPGR